ncbi:MAG TPA: hypothetical protein PLR04_04080 [Bacilli bacterium]|nr:hypothetical protein [Bacilli bacterium]
MSLNGISDEECVLLAQTGNYDALHYLCLRYQKYSYGLAITFYNTNRQSGIMIDDLCSVAQSTILIAIKNFSNNIQLFYPYWRTIATNALIKYNQQNSYYHHAKTFNGVSLDQQNDDYFSNDQIIGEPDLTMEKGIVEDTFLEIINDSNNGFTETEKTVMILTIEGYEPAEIMKIFKWTKSQVYYALKKAKEKLSSAISQKKH